MLLGSFKAPLTLTSHRVILESAEPVTILSSLWLPWRPHTLSWWASSVFTHSLVFMVHSFTKPSEPLKTETQGWQMNYNSLPTGKRLFKHHSRETSRDRRWLHNNTDFKRFCNMSCVSHPHFLILTRSVSGYSCCQRGEIIKIPSWHNQKPCQHLGQLQYLWSLFFVYSLGSDVFYQYYSCRTNCAEGAEGGSEHNFFLSILKHT